MGIKIPIYTYFSMSELPWEGEKSYPLYLNQSLCLFDHKHAKEKWYAVLLCSGKAASKGSTQQMWFEPPRVVIFWRSIECILEDETCFDSNDSFRVCAWMQHMMTTPKAMKSLYRWRFNHPKHPDRLSPRLRKHEKVPDLNKAPHVHVVQDTSSRQSHRENLQEI